VIIVLWPAFLEMFSEGTVSGPADIISVFHFSPRSPPVATVTLDLLNNVWTETLILQASFGEVVASGGIYTASLMYPQKKKIKGIEVRRTRCPSGKPAPANPFIWKLSI
jgi:hypothetical protein